MTENKLRPSFVAVRRHPPGGEKKGYIIAPFQSLPLGGKVLSVSEADEGHSPFLVF